MNLFGKEARDKLLEGIVELERAVGATLGPKGRNVFYEGSLTKDGVTVARHYQHKDPIANLGATMLKEVATKTVNSVGDGTTTSIILATSLVERGLRLIEVDVSPIEIKRGLEVALKNATDWLKNQSIQVKDNPELLYNVAFISSNNDEWTAKTVYEATQFAGEGVIVIEDSPNAETYLEKIEGLQFDTGLMIKEHAIDGVTTVLKDAAIVILPEKVTAKDQIITYIKQATERDILILAPDFTPAILDLITINIKAMNSRIIPVRIPGYGDTQKDWIEDICALTGIEYENLDTTYGSCDKVIITHDNTTIIGGQFDPEYLPKHIQAIKDARDVAVDQYNKDLINKRLARVEGKLCILYVGAFSSLESKEKKDRVEDALCAVRAALEEGISLGGGRTYLNLQNVMYGELSPSTLSHVPSFIGWNLFADVLDSPFNRLCENAGIDAYSNESLDLKTNIRKDCYNIDTGVIVDMYDAKIIEPTKLIITALSNAVSVASMILTTEVILNSDV